MQRARPGRASDISGRRRVVRRPKRSDVSRARPARRRPYERRSRRRARRLTPRARARPRTGAYGKRWRAASGSRATPPQTNTRRSHRPRSPPANATRRAASSRGRTPRTGDTAGARDRSPLLVAQLNERGHSPGPKGGPQPARWPVHDISFNDHRRRVRRVARPRRADERAGGDETARDREPFVLGHRTHSSPRPCSISDHRDPRNRARVSVAGGAG